MHVRPNPTILFIGIHTDSGTITRLTFYRRIFPIVELKLMLFIFTGALVSFIIASTTVIIFQWYALFGTLSI